MTDSSKAAADAEKEAKAKAEAEAKAAAEAEKARNEEVECRVICRGQFGAINDVVKVPRYIAEANQGGDLDASQSAVAFAKKLAKKAAAEAKKAEQGK